jgi:hypothetical protein
MPHYLLCNSDGLVLGYVECPEYDAENQLSGDASHMLEVQANEVPDFMQNEVVFDLETGVQIQSTPKQPTVDLSAIGRSIKKQRNKLLSLSDWTQVADAPVDQAAWATYRQALRDVPEQDGFPDGVVWPVPPL